MSRRSCLWFQREAVGSRLNIWHCTLPSCEGGRQLSPKLWSWFYLRSLLANPRVDPRIQRMKMSNVEIWPRLPDSRKLLLDRYDTRLNRPSWGRLTLSRTERRRGGRVAHVHVLRCLELDPSPNQAALARLRAARARLPKHRAHPSATSTLSAIRRRS